MNVIDEIMHLPPTRWIEEKIGILPDRAKFRAASAVRSLRWASMNYDAEMFIPAAYLALHATEEAVAAFVSCAKACGYGDDAKINLKDHRAKATVSLLVQKVSNLLDDYRIGIAVDPSGDGLAARLTINGSVHYREASTRIFHFTAGEHGDPKADFLDEVVATFGDIEELKRAVLHGQEVRNTILYATSTGLPTGFLDTEASLRRECQLTLGLIWASLDIVRNGEEPSIFIAQALRTASLVISQIGKK